MLIGYQDRGMAKLTQVVNVLSTWGYISVVKIKTKAEPALKITIKRSADFQKNFDSFAEALQKRREERDRERAAQKEADEAAAKTPEADEGVEAKAESEETPAGSDEASKAESMQAAAAPVQLELPSKA